MSRSRYDLVNMKIMMIIGVLALALAGFSCSDNGAPAEKNKVPPPQVSPELHWTDMLLRATDSTRIAWVDQLAELPETVTLTIDSTWQAHLADLTFAFEVWAFKNLDRAEDTNNAGLRLALTIAATHVPNYPLMKDLTVDSVTLSYPGETQTLVRRTMFPVRRKFLEGVWQVWFGPQETATFRVDFAENTKLLPRIYVSWQGRSFIFVGPTVNYEYSKTPKPIDLTGKQTNN